LRVRQEIWTLDDAKPGDDSFNDNNIIALRSGASSVEPAEEEGFHIGIISLQLKC
jgi:hypothetical protein